MKYLESYNNSIKVKSDIRYYTDKYIDNNFLKFLEYKSVDFLDNGYQVYIEAGYVVAKTTIYSDVLSVYSNGFLKQDEIYIGNFKIENINDKTIYYMFSVDKRIDNMDKMQNELELINKTKTYIIKKYDHEYTFDIQIKKGIFESDMVEFSLFIKNKIKQ